MHLQQLLLQFNATTGGVLVTVLAVERPGLLEQRAVVVQLSAAGREAAGAPGTHAVRCATPAEARFSGGVWACGIKALAAISPPKQ